MDEPFRVSAVEGQDLATVRAIYEAVFPASERKPSEFLTAAVRRDDYDMLIGRCGVETVAFALLYSSSREQVGLLEYMAVSPSWQGAGLASRLFADVLSIQGGRPLLVEVEAEGEGNEAARRLDFYARLGCRRIAGLRYRMPQVGTGPAPPMHLLLCNHAAPTLATGQLRTWLEAILEGAYGVDPPDHAVGEMLRGQPAVLHLV
jgi:GNAT superfamily N-acetyltransferase